MNDCDGQKVGLIIKASMFGGQQHVHYLHYVMKIVEWCILIHFTQVTKSIAQCSFEILVHSSLSFHQIELSLLFTFLRHDLLCLLQIPKLYTTLYRALMCVVPKCVRSSGSAKNPLLVAV